MVEGHVLIAKIKVKCFHYLTSSVKKNIAVRIVQPHHPKENLTRPLVQKREYFLFWPY